MCFFDYQTCRDDCKSCFYGWVISYGNLKPNCIDPILQMPCAFMKACCGEFACPDLPKFNGNSLVEGSASCGALTAAFIKNICKFLGGLIDSVSKIPWFILGCVLLLFCYYAWVLYQEGMDTMDNKIQLIIKKKILP